jgi:hypothetical protein
MAAQIRLSQQHIAHSITSSARQKEKYDRNRSGNRLGCARRNRRVERDVTALVPADSARGVTLTSAVSWRCKAALSAAPNSNPIGA